MIISCAQQGQLQVEEGGRRGELILGSNWGLVLKNSNSRGYLLDQLEKEVTGTGSL